VALLVSFDASAQLRDGQPIDTSDYTIDLHQGPVLSGARVVGLSGAYTSVAEGIQGYHFNPAAVAYRVPWSQTWFDWGLDGGFTLPAGVTEFDFDNNGKAGFNNSTALYLNGGLGFNLGDWGIGLTADWQLYQVNGAPDVDGNAQTLNINVWRALLVAGYGFLDNELVIGIGAATNFVNIERALVVGGSNNEGRNIATVNGPSFHAGVLWAPTYAPVRLGSGLRYALPPSLKPDARPECIEPQCMRVPRDGGGEDFIIDGDEGPQFARYLPRTLSLPTEIYLGATFQLFRPLNFGWVNPSDDGGRSPLVDKLEADIQRAREERKQQRDQLVAAAKKEGRDGELREDLMDKELDLQDAEDDQVDELERTYRLLPYKAMPRGKLMLIGGVRITMDTENGVGLDSFIEGVVERSGESITAQPHAAIEGEAWPGYLVLRGGSYIEPSRFAGVPPRIHGTGGLDIRIPIEWSVFGLLDDDNTFRVGGAIDVGVSQDKLTYLGWGVSAGIWR
jgi:hypothetical protein